MGLLSPGPGKEPWMYPLEQLGEGSAVEYWSPTFIHAQKLQFTLKEKERGKRQCGKSQQFLLFSQEVSFPGWDLYHLLRAVKPFLNSVVKSSYNSSIMAAMDMAGAVVAHMS